jgi:hypothetical protein
MHILYTLHFRKSTLKGICITLLLMHLIFSSSDALSQRIVFNPDDTETFLSQLSYITNGLTGADRTNAQHTLTRFSALWRSDSLTSAQKTTIVNTLDAMQGLRLSPWPQQGYYLQAITGLMKTRDEAGNFQVFHQSFQPLLNVQSQRRLVKVWESAVHLFHRNIIYNSSQVKWVLQNNDYSLSYSGNNYRIIFRGGNLKGFSQGDSTTIYNTSGEIDVLEDLFIARKGKITFERAGLHPDSVYALLNNYSINLTTTRWEADSVSFYNKHFFKDPIKGKLREQILADMNPETARFPRFESSQLELEIKNLFKGIDYKGGFTMAGARVIGSGTPWADATIKIYRNDSLFIAARGRNFSILKDRIVTQKAAVSIYLSGDSVYHPNINMRYHDPSREFSLLRDEKGFSRAPFTNSFHKIDMFCEAIYWNIDTYRIDLRMIRSISDNGEAFFESNDYFSDVRYMRMQGMSDLHPLIRLRNFSREYGSNTFFIAEYAKFIRADLASVSTQLLTFSQDGFLSINQDDETVTLSDKLFHYIASYAGRGDFDNIRINSQATVNAQINMNNFDLHLYGVERIPLSNKKNVVIYPYDRQVIMKKGRDIYFQGRIESGLFDFYGKEFFFNYDQFKIELIQTDSMSFRVRSLEPDTRGNYSLVRVKTVLEGINGELLVDHPRNKSGQLPYPRYPIFNSNNESFVFYDRDYVQEGVYHRDDVYFKLIPFSIDSLDNATTNNIAFDGVFISTGIFPDFYDYLTVQKDYSLGFNTKTPPSGYPIYDGKAIYKGPIDMSYEGLRADGELHYLNSYIKANKMLMFPDSARANADLFVLEAMAAPVEFPDVKAHDVDMLYLPNADVMNISNNKYPFSIYDGLALLDGSISINSDGLTGEGSLEIFGGKMNSEEFVFRLREFEAERTSLALLTADGKNTAVAASDYKAKINVDTKQAELANLQDESKVDFPFNRYQAIGFSLDWDLGAGKVRMQNKLREELRGNLTPEQWIAYNFKGNELKSTHTAQDGLDFYAGTIDYDVAENIIRAHEVKIIKVADAAIFPVDGEVRIKEKAEFELLANTLITANTTSQLHQFYQADVTITSRWNYYGKGNYDFTDEVGMVQQIHFEKISVDRATRTTIASGEIAKEQDFTISPRFGYFGKVDLRAEKADFFYAGSTNLMVDCPRFRPNWTRFEGEIMKDNVYIPLADDLRNEANGRIFTALMLSGDSLYVYPAILDRQKHYSDLPLLSATGFLTFNKDLGEYQISTAERLRKPSLPDNIISINPATCLIEGHGDVTLSNNMGQFKLTTYGKIVHDLPRNDVNMDLVMGINFYFLNPALGLVESNINKSSNTRPLNINRFKYTTFLHKQVGELNSQRLMSEFLADSAFSRFPNELRHTFFLADVRMRWDPESHTFYSKGPIGIGNMERFPMNKYVDGYLEIKKNRNGDIFNMVMVPSGFVNEGIGVDWFYFTYTQGQLQSIGSSPEFNNMIRSVKANKRRMNVERGQEPFVFLLSSDRRPFDFVRSIRSIKE